VQEKRACLTLLLGRNASGVHKTKLLMDLPVVWHSNKKALITRAVFESYFCNELRLEGLM
jgi:hypothetical protein